MPGLLTACHRTCYRVPASVGRLTLHLRVTGPRGGGGWPRDPLQAWRATGSICCACCPRMAVLHTDAQTQQGCQLPSPLSFLSLQQYLALQFAHYTCNDVQKTCIGEVRDHGLCCIKSAGSFYYSDSTWCQVTVRSEGIYQLTPDICRFSFNPSVKQKQ